MWTRDTRLDYAFPEFANIGEQELFNYEVWAEDTTYNDMLETFGYIPRYAEYKYRNSYVSGEFTDTLEYWHLARKFTTAPTLSETFINCIPDRRILVSSEEPAIFAHIINNVQVKRCLPKFGNPKL
jgi:hypothetical protein